MCRENSRCSVYVDRYQRPVHCNDGPVVDIVSLVNRLPRDLLVKIYNEYFRPVKFYQLYTYVIRNPLCIDLSVYSSNKEIFVSHLPVFLFGSIWKYIQGKDETFNQVMNMFQERGRTSIFKSIPQLKSSLYLELTLYKSQVI